MGPPSVIEDVTGDEIAYGKMWRAFELTPEELEEFARDPQLEPKYGCYEFVGKKKKD